MTSFLDRALDAAVVPGFSRIGFVLRSRVEHWADIDAMPMNGRIVVITGPTSGLGAETARMLARAGAQLVLVGRNPEKCDAIAAELRAMKTQPVVDIVRAEMGDLESVASASNEISRRFPRVDVLVHNAGALLKKRESSPQGIEQTVASHVVGPHLMTTVLRDVLRATHGRVVTVSSGLDPMPWATGGVVLQPASRPLASVRQSRVRRPRPGVPMDVAQLRVVMLTPGGGKGMKSIGKLPSDDSL